MGFGLAAVQGPCCVPAIAPGQELPQEDPKGSVPRGGQPFRFGVWSGHLGPHPLLPLDGWRLANRFPFVNHLGFLGVGPGAAAPTALAARLWNL